MNYQQALEAAIRQSALHGDTLAVREKSDGSFYVSQITLPLPDLPVHAVVSQGIVIIRRVS